MAARLSGGENRLVSLPLSRIRVIMKSSPEVSSINQDALFLTAKATVPAPSSLPSLRADPAPPAAPGLRLPEVPRPAPGSQKGFVWGIVPSG